MKKRIIIISACAAATVLLIGVLLLFGYWMPYRGAETTMDGGTMVLTRHEDGSTTLSWPKSTSAQQYQVEVLKSGTVLFQQVTGDLSCKLTDLPLSETLTIRVSSIANYEFLFSSKIRQRVGTAPLEVTGILAPPAVTAVAYTVDPETDLLQLQFSQKPGSTATLLLCADSQTVLQSTDQGAITLAFGQDGDLELPAYGVNLDFTLTSSSTLPGMELHWYTADRITVCREDFLGVHPNLVVTDEGENRFTLHWDETKGEHQLLQRWNADTQEWETVQKYLHADMLTYDTGYLPKYNQFIYRVIGVGGQTLPDSEYAAVSDSATLTTGASALFATIWPIQNLEVYSLPQGGEVVGIAPEGMAFCVAEVSGDMFCIRYEGDKMGYINANYCMVNLPEYMEDRCIYHIANSFESRYMIHNYEIPEVTDKVTVGYENVKLTSGEYLVPLLYPAAKKLDTAAALALNQGYQLMIYDSYRPQKATLDLYDTATELLEEPLPPQDYYEMDGENANLGDDPNATPITYEMLMTDNGRYNLSYFLAKGGSRHNMGIALDLTLFNLATGQEVEMQTKMHDLSWQSEIKLNNNYANILYSIMTQAGFGGLTSEWWHYQDNDALNDLKLTNFMYTGISARCWMVDENGWRYRNTSGIYETNCVKNIDGIAYNFDAQGYATVTEDYSDDQEDLT